MNTKLLNWIKYTYINIMFILIVGVSVFYIYIAFHFKDISLLVFKHFCIIYCSNIPSHSLDIIHSMEVLDTTRVLIKHFSLTAFSKIYLAHWPLSRGGAAFSKIVQAFTPWSSAEILNLGALLPREIEALQGLKKKKKKTVIKTEMQI